MIKQAPKRILLLADSQSIHTYKWSTSLAQRGYAICIFSLNQTGENFYEKESKIKVVHHTVSGNAVQNTESNFLKLKYLTAIFKLKKTIRQFQPDVVHAHYATSYGLLGALSGFQPFLISVWGSDVFEFPRKSVIHQKILSYNLRHARFIFSASKALLIETKKYTSTPIEIVPFGIDTEKFRPKVVNSIFAKDEIVIGTIKSLEKIYGIDYLIKAFNKVRLKHPGLPLKLLVAGSGSEELTLKNLTSDLKLESHVVFTGRIGIKKLADYHNMITIFAALSLSESFGVAVLEASSCGKPVVVSDVGGLPEIVENNSTGIIVASSSETEATGALEKLVLDNELREKFGKNGREKVLTNFNWNDNVSQMVNYYEEILST